MDLVQELAALQRMSPAQLREKYTAVFGEPTRAGHKAYLIRKIAWRLQAQAEGGLSARAQRRADELARDEDLRTRAPKRQTKDTSTNSATVVTQALTADAPAPSATSRLPAVGSVLRRDYRGAVHLVTVCADGFEYEGRRFKSLTAVATAITGTHWNGYHFFGLKKPTKRLRAAATRKPTLSTKPK